MGKIIWGVTVTDQIKVDEISGTRSTHGLDEKCIQNISRKT